MAGRRWRFVRTPRIMRTEILHVPFDSQDRRNGCGGNRAVMLLQVVAAARESTRRFPFPRSFENWPRHRGPTIDLRQPPPDAVAMKILDSEGYASFEPTETVYGTCHPPRMRYGRGQWSRRSFPLVFLFASKFSQGRQNSNSNSDLVVASETLPSDASDEDETVPSAGRSNVQLTTTSPSTSLSSMSASDHGQPGGSNSLSPALPTPRFALTGSAELV
jgi:hypothetical protein